MYARVWKFNVLPEKLDEFAAACRAVGAINHRSPEFRGFVVVRGGPKDSPECTVVSVWISLEALRASENEAFQQAVSRALTYCKPGAALQEEDVLVCDFSPPKKPAAKRARPKPSKKRNK